MLTRLRFDSTAADGEWQLVNSAPSSEWWTCPITRTCAFTGDVEVPGKLKLFGGVCRRHLAVNSRDERTVLPRRACICTNVTLGMFLDSNEYRTTNSRGQIIHVLYACVYGTE